MEAQMHEALTIWTMSLAQRQGSQERREGCCYKGQVITVSIVLLMEGAR